MKNIYFILSIILLGFSSCEKDIKLEIPTQEPRLAVHAIWERDDSLKVVVTRSFSVTETPWIDFINDPYSVESRLKRYGVENAKVLVYRDNSVYDELVLDKQRFIYKSATGKTAIPGYRYEVKVTAPGFKEVKSPVVSFPDKVLIKSSQMRQNVSRDESGSSLHELVIELDDPATAKNFYWLKLERQYNSSSTSPTYYLPLTIYPIDKDIIIPAGTELGTSLIAIDADKILLKDDNFNGQTKKITIRMSSWIFDPTNPSVKLYITLTNANEDVFKYIRSRLLDVDNPFSTPIQTYSNIDQGLGIFGLCSGDRKLIQ